MARIYVGTSGFNYKDWANGIFYPKALPQGQWLNYYSRQFNSVEINMTFYRLPKKEVFENWRMQTAKDFAFSIKGSRFITHIKKLKVKSESLGLFFENASALGDKFSVVLWQLPSSLHANVSNLKHFCKLISNNKIASRVRHSFEFRDSSWFTKAVYDILGKYNFCLCFAHSKNWPLFKKITADFIYLRFHGADQLYGSSYSDSQLKPWVDEAARWIGQKRDVYAYFNNDIAGYAPENAKRLGDMIRNT